MDKACIIGAGSSGIASAKVLKQHGIPFDCYERGSGIGGNWRYRNDNGMSAAYRSLHINTSKDRMAYSDYPMPTDFPDYLHHSQVLEYFEGYVDHFDFRGDIRFGTTVEEVAPVEGGGWDVTVTGDSGTPETHRYTAVLVSNGHHWDPRHPEFAGHFDGPTRHSHSYETSEGLEDRNVLVVGIGNSGVDIACEVSRVARRTMLSTRRSAHILPKYALGRPIDTYTTPAANYLPLKLQQAFFNLLMRLSHGSQDHYGVPTPEHTLLQAHPTISAELLNLAGHGKVTIKPDITELQGDRVAFRDGTVEPVDEIIYATGYKISFPFLSSEVIDSDDNEVRLYRLVAHPHRKNLFFVGLIQPLGAVMPLAEAQSIWVAKLLTGECALPDLATMEQRIDADLAAMRKRYVTSKRHTIQVDFFAYRDLMRKEVRRGRQPAARRAPIIAPLQAAAHGP
ncbi:MAG: NAD(P)-binding domain-containing protein [Acidobacteriota bacterium]